MRSFDSLLGLDEPDEPVIPPTRPPRTGVPPVGPIDLEALSEGSGGHHRYEDEDEGEGVESQRYIYHVHGQGRIVLWQWNWWGELCRRFLLPGSKWIRKQRSLVIDRIPFETNEQGEMLLTTVSGAKVTYSEAGYGWYIVPPRVEVERYVLPLGNSPGNLPMLRQRPLFVQARVTDLPKTLTSGVPFKRNPTPEEIRHQLNPELRRIYMDLDVQGLIAGQAPRLQLRGWGSDSQDSSGLQAEEVSIEAGIFEA